MAQAFLIPEANRARGYSGAKQTIKASQVPFSLPTASEGNARLVVVLHVLYLMFNEGYTTSAGPYLQRCELSSEAIRLTRALLELLPKDAEVAGPPPPPLFSTPPRHPPPPPHSSLNPLPTPHPHHSDP